MGDPTNVYYITEKNVLQYLNLYVLLHTVSNMLVEPSSSSVQEQYEENMRAINIKDPSR